MKSSVVRRQKKTFSLSVESVAFLNAIAENYRSHSEALDQIIREKMLEAERKRISASITNYYDSIGDEEMEENRAWGELAQTQLPEE
jgi:hypothetical protein